MPKTNRNKRPRKQNLSDFSKMSTPDSPDVIIGKDKKIEWIEPKDIDNAFSLDDFLKPTIDWWTAMEDSCEAECCGIQAFDLTQEAVSKATKADEASKVKQELIKLRQAVDELEACTLVSTRLNNYFDRVFFLQLIDHLIGAVSATAK